MEYNNLPMLEKMLSSNPNIASFIVEPIQGEAGVFVPVIQLSCLNFNKIEEEFYIFTHDVLITILKDPYYMQKSSIILSRVMKLQLTRYISMQAIYLEPAPSAKSIMFCL